MVIPKYNLTIINKYYLSALLIFLFSCGLPEAMDVAGRYYAKHGKGTEYIELREDHTYTHYFKNDKYEYKKNGVWEIERNKDFQLRLILTNWQTIIEPIAKKEPINLKKILRPGGANMFFSRDVLELFEDDDLNFHKENK